MAEFRTICISDPRFEHDGLRHVTVKSASLRGRGDVTVWAPQVDEPPAGLVILLHGVYGSHWSWALQGGAHRTAARLVAAGDIPPFALAMPSDGLRGDGSGYVRHGDGFDAARWVVDEVPRAAREAIPGLSPEAPRFIAGLSMGGFGALRLGATHPGAWRAVSGHSSITHLSQMAQFIEEDVASLGAASGDVSVLDAMVGAGDRLPAVRFDCGVDDQLIEENRALHRALAERGIPHVYEEFPGAHAWEYWERHLEDSLRFFAARV
ncbi:alpha/beta hydrolase family protein [Luteitalea sp. TBR-22]|uniref:alpha/beta hydrolase n=1 Tax=Luteitalea sp. TBR-22 TaxID=2802971 RepID=UPI001EF45EC5|nr:alpha/beta hydrolase-fold protein [Luteitalea sp. TBR-22]